MKTRYIHIGYPKTGTTTLQSGFFATHPELCHLGVPFVSDEIRDAIEIDIMMKDSLTHSPSKVRDVFAPFLEQAERDDTRKAVGVSYEGLCFALDGGNADRRLIAERLCDLFGDAKVIITIRNQFNMIQSLYNMFLAIGCFLSFDDFLEAHYWRFYTFMFNQLYYYELFRCYRDMFGKGRVKVFLFEDFKSQANETINQMCSFLEIAPQNMPVPHENPGLSSFSTLVLRFINRLYKNQWGRSYFMPVGASLAPGMAKAIQYAPRDIERRDAIRRKLDLRFRSIDARLGLKSYRPRFSEAWVQRITEVYAESNQKLMDETGLDLARYGYPLASARSADAQPRNEGSFPVVGGLWRL